MTILFVDDDADKNCRYYVSVLETSGFRVIRAKNHAEAKVAINKSISDQESIDLILFDMIIPSVDGTQLSSDVGEDVREFLHYKHERLSETPIWVLSILSESRIQDWLRDVAPHSKPQKTLAKNSTSPSQLCQLVRERLIREL
jgi:PleD family two-component response regulator